MRLFLPVAVSDDFVSADDRCDRLCVWDSREGDFVNCLSDDPDGAYAGSSKVTGRTVGED